MNKKITNLPKVHFVLGDGVYPHHVGGMEIFNYYLIRELAHDVDLYYSSPFALPFENVNYYKTFHIRPTKIFTPLQVFLFHLFHWSVKNVVFSYSAAHWSVWRQYAWIVKLFRLNSIVVVHYGWRPDGSENPQRIRKFFKVSKTVVAVSEDIKSNYDKGYDIKCQVIPPLVPFEKSSLSKVEARRYYSIPQDAFVIAMVGSLKPMKNPQTLLESLILFSEEERKAIKPHVVFAGDGVLRTTLETYVVEQGLADSVTLLGNIPKEQICDVMALTDCYVIASDFEGTSVSVLEAMYNRKPIAYAEVPGLQDMLEDGVTGSAFTCKNAKALKNVLLDMCRQPKTAQQMADTAYKVYQQRYNYSQVVTAYKNMFV